MELDKEEESPQDNRNGEAPEPPQAATAAPPQSAGPPAESRPEAAAEPPPEPMEEPQAEPPGNGLDQGDASAEPGPGEADGAEPPPEPPINENPLTELANTAEGCWKITKDGQKTTLTEAEWKRELTRLYSREKVTQ